MGLINTFWKVGNQETAFGKEHKGYKHGMLVDVQPASVIPGKMDKKAYVILQVNESYKDFLIPKLQPYGLNQDDWKLLDGVSKLSVRISQAHIDLDELESKLKITGIKDQWEGKGVSVEPIDASVLGSTIFKDSIIKDFGSEITDRNAISSGSYYIGSGGDYATWRTFFSDFTTFTGNITGTQISDITTTASATSSVNTAGYDLYLTSDTPHHGNPNLGWITYSGGSYSIFSLDFEDNTGGTVIHIAQLYFKSTSISFGECIQIRNDITNGWECKVFDCMADGNGYAYTTSAKFFRHNAPLTVCTSETINCKTWDMYYGFQWSDGSNGVGLVENCITYNTIFRGIDGYGRVGHVYNSIIHNQSGVCSNTDNCTYCALSDDTGGGGGGGGADNWENITIGDWVSSVDDTDDNFLGINSGNSNAKDGGKNTGLFAENTEGIEGNARPHDTDKVSINAHEWGGDVTPPSFEINSVAK